jgi:hypothetical protein
MEMEVYRGNKCTGRLAAEKSKHISAFENFTHAI